jgi:hypothetical protein
MSLERAKFLHVGDLVWYNDAYHKVVDTLLWHDVVVHYEGLSQPVHYKSMDLLHVMVG